MTASQQTEDTAAERKRQRDVFLLYGSALTHLPKIELPDAAHVPRPCVDSTLTALAAFAATRLEASRACVSLIDDKYQHFIAEATPTCPLRPQSEDTANTLWLGNASVSRSWGVCEQVLEASNHHALVINDLSQCVRHANRHFVKEGPQWRFYAGAPLISPHGTVVGVLSVWDPQPRDFPGLSAEHVTLLQDFAVTIIKYLDTYTIRDQYQRGEQFTRGLLSFAQGASTLRPFKIFTDDSSNASAPASIGSDRTAHTLSTSAPSSIAPPTIEAFSSSNDQSINTLQNSILPPHSRDMFSRAANVMMATSNLDGVLILDASVAATGHRQFPGSNDDDESAAESSNSKSSSSDESSLHSSGQEAQETKPLKKCSVLGYAVQRSTLSEGNALGTFLEKDLARLFRESPAGKIINFTASGTFISSNDDTSSSDPITSGQSPVKKKRKNTPQRHSSTAIHALIPTARSVAFVPFWDYERSRWFAGCICWSNSPQRLLSPTVDMNYFKIFSDSIMRELSRLDALASHQQKTTFVASISHELRSPLHGILGTLEFIKDTQLDSFQTSMLNSLHSCGQTLLDTITQVMDYAKSNDATKVISSRKLKDTNTLRLSSKPLKNRKPKQRSTVDLSAATEEVVEAVFSGALYVPIIGANEGWSSSESEDDPVSSNARPSSNRKLCYIVLDIAQADNWEHFFAPGAWKRIIMNLFGNAVKYTDSGHIQVSLRSSSSTEDVNPKVTLTIKDSGIGMSESFLANRAFQPFSQENPHSSGVGLGLSIVRQIIETNGGKMEVSSEPGVGTSFTVKLSLAKPEVPPEPIPRKIEFMSTVSRLAGRRVCILHKSQTPSTSMGSFGNSGGLLRFTDALAKTLETHLHMRVVQTEDWSDHDADLVICPEPSFEYLDTIRRRRVDSQRAPVTIFVAMDALEAATLQSDHRVVNKESVVEIIAQPCGPYKLANVLNACIDRFNDIQTQKQVSFPKETLSNDLPGDPVASGDAAEPELLPESSDVNPDDLKSDTATSVFSVLETPPVELKQVLPIQVKPSNPHVLVTDDNAINRKLLVAFLKKNKMPFSEAENGLEALQSYQNPSIRYDFILMDMSMPVMDGMAATRAIRQYEQTYNVPRCCIIALTGLASNSARLEAFSSGIDQFMTKPVDFEKLSEVLGRERTRRLSLESPVVREGEGGD